MFFLLALIAQKLGFSIAIGTFLAGIGLASLPYHYDIIGRVGSLKDCFATIFFVSLGMQLVFIDMNLLISLLVFLLIVVIFKPFIIFILVRLFGYENRTSFLTANSSGQISEFSLILVSIGFVTRSISETFFSLVVFLAIITITLTSYLMKYENKLYSIFTPSLSFFNRIFVAKRKLEYGVKSNKKDVILFGAHRIGNVLLNKIIKLNKKVLVVDHNPNVISRLIKEKVPCVYGDVANTGVLDKLGLRSVKAVFSTVPSFEDNAFLIEYVKHINKNILVVVIADHMHQAMDLYQLGADYVIMPHITGAEAFAHNLLRIMENKKEIVKLRNDHIKHLFYVERIH